jgi:hypothetical protein
MNWEVKVLEKRSRCFRTVGTAGFLKAIVLFDIAEYGY